ncbi:RING finger 141-like protein [Daphnia magna]|uniref:RING finger 141-like protein n=1 Tax=Daphnia magna TaxID=35525 RepID=A0A162NJH4_9CRUS|nr:RING finger 141-like protein [Daphnia magna]
MVYANLIGTQDRNIIYRTSHPNCIAIAISIIGFIFWKCHKKRMPSSRKQVEVSVEECPICLEPYVDKYWLNCCHTFCYKCLVKWTRIKLQCPMCRHPITDSIPWIKDSPSDEISDYEPDPNVDAEDDEVVILAEQQPDDNWVLYLDDEAIEMPMPISGSRVFVEVLMNTDEFHLALLDGIGRIVGEHLDISSLSTITKAILNESSPQFFRALINTRNETVLPSPTVLLERKRIIMARCYLLAILLCSQLVVSTLGLPVAPGEPLDETNDGQLILPIADGESDNSQNIASLPVNPISEDLNEDKDAEYAVDGTAYQAELMAIEQDPLTQSLPGE